MNDGISLGDLAFKAEDLAGQMWTDSSGDSHFITEQDAHELATRVNDILREKLSSAGIVLPADVQSPLGAKKEKE